MATTLTWDTVRDLSGFRAGNGCAITLYLNLDPSVAPTQPDVAARINSLLNEAQRQCDEQRERLSHDGREGLKADLERVQRWFTEEFDRDGARGVAVYAAGGDGFFAAHTLTEPVEDDVRIGTELYLAPLVRLVGSGEGALVAYVGRERAQVYRLRGGRLTELTNESSDVPGQHDQGGWSQARYERHIETIVGRHLRQVADSLDACVRRLRGIKVVLVGAEEIRPEFEALLSNEVKECLVGWAQAERHAGPPELLEAAGPLLREWRATREEQLLARWREAAGREGRASAGWKDTLDAASDGRVDLLLVQEGVDRAAYRCPECGRVQSSNGSCPLDGAGMEEQEHGLDLAVRRTLAHGGTVSVIRDRRDLEPVEGIGALLRF